MEQNLTIEQINAIREQRRQRFQQMGVSNAGQMMNESTVAGGKTNLNILQKIQQIKSGAAKQELSKYVNATAKPGSLPGAPGFEALPVPKPKGQSRNPNVQQPSVDPAFKVQLDSFSAPSSHVDNSELSMIDAMFAGGGGGGSRMNPQQFGFDNGQPFMQQRGRNTQLDLDSTLSQMPTFNPATAINRAKSKAANGHNAEYLKFAQSNPIGNPEDYVDPSINQQFNSMGITPAMKMMMETIAKTMAEQTIRQVLNEFTQKQQNNKNTFEIYNKEQNIIKTSDGKLYKITPVQVKKKS